MIGFRVSKFDFVSLLHVHRLCYFGYALDLSPASREIRFCRRLDSSGLTGFPMRMANHYYVGNILPVNLYESYKLSSRFTIVIRRFSGLPLLRLLTSANESTLYVVRFPGINFIQSLLHREILIIMRLDRFSMTFTRCVKVNQPVIDEVPLDLRHKPTCRDP